MNLVIFLFGLPFLMGYLLFVAITGRLKPYSKPQELAHRPVWFLAISTALVISGVVCLTALATFRLPLEQLDSLWLASASLLAALLVLNACVNIWYRGEIDVALSMQSLEEAQSSDIELAIQLAKINQEGHHVKQQSSLPFVDCVNDSADDSFVETLLFDKTMLIEAFDADATVRLDRLPAPRAGVRSAHKLEDTQLGH